MNIFDTVLYDNKIDFLFKFLNKVIDRNINILTLYHSFA